MSKRVLWVLTGLLLAGCNRGFSDDLAFQAPAGWVYSAAQAVARFGSSGNPAGRKSPFAAGTMPFLWSTRATRDRLGRRKHELGNAAIHGRLCAADERSAGPASRGSHWQFVSTLVRAVSSGSGARTSPPKRAQIIGGYLCEAGWNAQVAAAKQGPTANAPRINEDAAMLLVDDKLAAEGSPASSSLRAARRDIYG